MNSKYLASLFLAIFCLFGANLFASDSLQVKLFGRVESDQTKLYWEVRGWPLDLIGFQISQYVDDQWVPLTEEVTQPGVYFGRRWNDLGISGSLMSDVTSELNDITRGGSGERLPAEMVDALQTHGGLRSGDRLAMKRNFASNLGN